MLKGRKQKDIIGDSVTLCYLKLSLFNLGPKPLIPPVFVLVMGNGKSSQSTTPVLSSFLLCP